MDIKGTIDQIVSKLQGDPNLLENFTKDPIKTIEGISGIDIPDGMEQQVVDGVKAVLSGASGGIGGVIDSVKGIFGAK